ncbi:unnamed protein product [Paramecium octaurelia]|uniref:Uncharacterized protein n=1 Tax=Paramecium octaurelia TaxID=43137 RepID=A0A8S1VW78_PAROT|nr:unnamed protein product [Paramecium octaurelia]
MTNAILSQFTTQNFFAKSQIYCANSLVVDNTKPNNRQLSIFFREFTKQLNQNFNFFPHPVQALTATSQFYYVWNRCFQTDIMYQNLNSSGITF